ncbi:MAG: isocitrate lyase/PEP mutase family protein [Rhodoferax sp.]
MTTTPPNPAPRKTSSERGLAMRALHQQGTFVMPNAWDAGSARLLEAEGFQAIGTTSAGIAFSMGRPDSADAVSRDEMLRAIEKIAAAVRVPVNADLEAGYGEHCTDVAYTIALAIQAGASGGNIEDASGDASAPLFERARAAERIAAARAAADASGTPFVLTARCDAFLCGHPDALAQSIERCQLYRQAGADCLFVPGLREPAQVQALVQAVQAPVNVVMGLSGCSWTHANLSAWGVRRISTGGSLARACLALVRNAARDMRDHGHFRFAHQQIPDDELCRFFASYPHA